MRVEFAEAIQKAILEDVGIEFSILEVNAMKRLQGAVNAEVYAVVTDDWSICAVQVSRKYGEIDDVSATKFPLPFKK